MAITAALIAGGATLGAAGLGALGRSGGAGPTQDTSFQQLQFNKDQLTAQLQQEALRNQRAVAGSSDSFGTTVKYDPLTNQWISNEGPLPQAADRAAMQAGITRNTTDLQQQELINRESARRAGMAAPIADAAVRELGNYRPMTPEALRGLLTQQNTEAARAAYDPLRADTLRAVARTGTAAGPVLAQLGKSEADNLRTSLRDALITSLTGTDQINQSRRAGLENAAVNASSLASPQIGQTNIQPSANNSTLGQLVSQRAANSAYTTQPGDANPGGSNTAYANLIKSQGQIDPNFGLNQAATGLKELGTAFQPNGTGSNLLKQLFPGSSVPQSTVDYNQAYQQGAFAANPGQEGPWK